MRCGAADHPHQPSDPANQSNESNESNESNQGRLAGARHRLRACPPKALRRRARAARARPRRVSVADFSSAGPWAQKLMSKKLSSPLAQHRARREAHEAEQRGVWARGLRSQKRQRGQEQVPIVRVGRRVARGEPPERMAPEDDDPEVNRARWRGRAGEHRPHPLACDEEVEDFGQIRAVLIYPPRASRNSSLRGPRRRARVARACLWSCETRLSVTSSTRPMSAMVSFSK